MKSTVSTIFGSDECLMFYRRDNPDNTMFKPFLSKRLTPKNLYRLQRALDNIPASKLQTSARFGITNKLHVSWEIRYDIKEPNL